MRLLHPGRWFGSGRHIGNFERGARPLPLPLPHVVILVIHLHYQFRVYALHEGERALALYQATGKVDDATFAAYGYKGWVTTI